MTKAFALALLLLVAVLSACTSVIKDPVDGSVMAKCYTGGYQGFCVIHRKPDEQVISTSGVVPTANTASGMVTEGVAIGTLVSK